MTDVEDTRRSAAGPHRAGPGRPRRFDDAEEIDRLLDGAFRVVARRRYEDVTIADILSEAGVARRSFYRHFAGKDDLLRALLRRDAERFAATVGRRVQAAPDPWSALVAWIDGILALDRDSRRARRAAVLGTRSVGSVTPADLRHAYVPLLAPLRAALVAGTADGTFLGSRPEFDMHLVNAAAWDTLGRLRDATGRAEKDELRAALLTFLRRALGGGDEQATAQEQDTAVDEKRAPQATDGSGTHGG